MAVLIAALSLVAACSSETGGQVERIEPIPPNPSVTTSSPTSTSQTSPTTSKPAAPPAPGAPIKDVIGWIEAGDPADAAQYHAATRDGTTTDLGDDVAFTTPSGKTSCITDTAHTEGALSCLVDLANPPPRPPDAYGEWKGGWIDYDGASVSVGSVRADPGRFTAGEGAELPYGKVLSFGDYRCRTDTVGLFCANYAHQSAARLSDAGVQPFGCLQPTSPPPQVGEKFSC